jgi:hypothetical protein
MRLAATLFLVIVVGNAYAGPYEDCILANMKGVQDRAAAFAVRQACEDKTTPKRCREGRLGITYTFEDTGKKELAKLKRSHPSYDLVFEQCLADCAAASYWSRTFGECSTD